jgi:two-component system LytT family response regulator
MMKLKTIIIDDEPDSTRLLQLKLAQHCPQVEVIAVYNSSVKAFNEIESLQPDLLFLDIEMPLINGFELLEKLGQINFSVVFITAYNQYALKAFRFNALDYLLKPIETDSLIESVAKAGRQVKPTTTQLSLVQRQMRGEIASKIAIPGQNGVSFIELNEIVFVEASSNYSRLVLSDKRVFTVSKTLKDVQDVLEESHFLRVHRQYIINLNHVKQFNRNESILVMDSGAHLPIARNQKERLVEKYGWL